MMTWKYGKFLSLMLCTAIMIGACGCSMDLKTQMQKSDEKIIQEMQAHLEAKYGEISYEQLGFEPSGFYHNNDLLRLAALNADGTQDEFWVKRYTDDAGAVTIEDNYFWLCIRNDYESEMTLQLQAYFGSCAVYLASYDAAFPNRFDRSVSYRNLQSDDMAQHMLWIFVDAGSFSFPQEIDAASDAFYAAYAAVYPTCLMRVFYLGEGKLNSVNRYNMFNFNNSETCVQSADNWPKSNGGSGGINE